ncbi:hypothetical protein HY620_00585 [Candidatus Uhrbacteria bacterium]|nr:hypothetical protein [Candidatus Uhrbacteria bacterium]
MEQENEKLEERKTALSEQEKIVNRLETDYATLAREGREKLRDTCGAYEALITFHKNNPEKYAQCHLLCQDILTMLPEGCPEKRTFERLLIELNQSKPKD